MAFRVFDSTGWNGSAAAVELGTLTTCLGTGVYTLYPTLDKALAGAEAGDTVAPVPQVDVGGVHYGTAFLDAGGFPVQTVTVPLGANLTISTAITLCGGAYRLRLDGTSGGYTVRIGAAVVAYDVDFICGATSAAPIASNMSFGAYRCSFYHYRSSNARIGGYSNTFVYQDCLFVNCVSTHSTPTLLGGGSTATRCTFYGCSRNNNEATLVDCVTVRPTSGADPGVAPSDVFVGGASIPDDPSTVTDWSGATDWDFRLLSTSSYATGGTSVTSGSTVYDLDGLPRKVGGALGAYECYVINYVSRSVVPGWTYSVARNGSDAPNCVGFFAFQSGSNVIGRISFDNCDSLTKDGVSVSVYRYGNPIANVSVSNGSVITATTSGGVCVVTVYAPGYAVAGAVSQAIDMGAAFSWSTISGANTSQVPPTTSCVKIGGNCAFFNSNKTFMRFIVPGKTHVDLGNNGGGAELVIGLGATVTASGSVTIKEETNTDAELWAKLTLESGATLTLDDCATSDAA